MRSNKKSVSYVNLESEEKFYTSDKHFCSQDGFVAFRRGELISGNLGKCNNNCLLLLIVIINYYWFLFHTIYYSLIIFFSIYFFISFHFIFPISIMIIGKKTLGGDTKSSLFYILIRDYGALEVRHRLFIELFSFILLYFTLLKGRLFIQHLFSLSFTIH